MSESSRVGKVQSWQGAAKNVHRHALSQKTTGHALPVNVYCIIKSLSNFRGGPRGWGYGGGGVGIPIKYNNYINLLLGEAFFCTEPH